MTASHGIRFAAWLSGHARLALAAGLLLLAAPHPPAPGARAGEQPESPVYGTWGGFLEVDRCAAAWVIDRFVEGPGVRLPERGKEDEGSGEAPGPAADSLHARFRFYPSGTIIRDAEPFDTPDAKRYARHPGTCIMETVMAVHELGKGDPALLEVARVVRDAELNKWGERMTPEAEGVERIIRGLNDLSRDEMDCLRRTFGVFDALYAAFRARFDG